MKTAWYNFGESPFKMNCVHPSEDDPLEGQETRGRKQVKHTRESSRFYQVFIVALLLEFKKKKKSLTFLSSPIWRTDHTAALGCVFPPCCPWVPLPAGSEHFVSVQLQTGCAGSETDVVTGGQHNVHWDLWGQQRLRGLWWVCRVCNRVGGVAGFWLSPLQRCETKLFHWIRKTSPEGHQKVHQRRAL